MKTEKILACPGCNSKEIAFSESIKDHYFSKDVFEIWECRRCSLKFTQDRPDEDSISKYYDSSNYASHESDSKKSLLLWIYKIARNYMLGQKWKLLRSFKPEAHRSLDYGTGEGFYTEYLHSKGLQVTGVEPSIIARQNFHKRTGANLYANLNEIPSEYIFQSISLWHVLEHVHNLRDTMSELVSRLDPKGVIIIAVPNQQSYDLKKFGVHWAAWDVPRHLYHWNYESIKTFLDQFGLKNVHIGQLPLDPYYIGLISAKYANEGFATGLSTGLKSYLHGNSTKTEGSTLLTIWMKK